jgi:hypothetical protein
MSKSIDSTQNTRQTVMVVRLTEELTEEGRMKEENLMQVLLLVESLIEREEITIKLILSRLYNVGSVNLINQKFQNRSLNRLMKLIARLSKPVFKVVALRWVKRNCPRLIVNWLRKKVSFEPARTIEQAAIASTVNSEATNTAIAAQQQAVIASTADSEVTSAASPGNSSKEIASGEIRERPTALLPATPQPANGYSLEVLRLRSQVRWLTGILIGVTLFLGSAALVPNLI